MTAILKNRIYNVAGTNGADVTASGELKVINTPSGTQPVSGPLTDTQLRATPVPVSGTVTTGGLTDTELRASAVPVSLTSTTISNFPATQPVSAVSLPLPTGAATETTLATLLTDAQLRATPVPISGTVTATPTGTQNVDITGNTIGLSTSALQTAGNASLTSIDTKLTSPLTVQATDLDIRNLVFATDKVDVSGSAVTVATLPLPTGASTSALQTTGNTALATLDTSVNTLLKPADTLTAVTTVGTLTGTTTLTPGTGATNLGKAEDAVHATGDVGVMMLGVRDDIVSSKTSLSGDYSPMTTDSAGRLVTTPISSRSSRIHTNVTLTTTTETTVIPAAAGFFNDICNIVVSNQGAGNEIITIRSGLAGTILMTITSLANTTEAIPLLVPIPATAINLPITAQMNAAAATGVAVAITAIRNI